MWIILHVFVFKSFLRSGLILCYSEESHYIVLREEYVYMAFVCVCVCVCVCYKLCFAPVSISFSRLVSSLFNPHE